MLSVDRRLYYSAGPVGFALELYETGTWKPNPVGMASWQVANSASMYLGTRWLTGEGQTLYSVYKPVVTEELRNLKAAIRGPPKSPPLGVFATLAIGLDTFRVIDSTLGLTEVSMDQQFA